jgi:hypothetical protein
MRPGFDITVPGAHGERLELEGVEAWNRHPLAEERNLRGESTMVGKL